METKKCEVCPGCWKKVGADFVPLPSKYGHGYICSVCSFREAGEGDFIREQDEFVNKMLQGNS